MRVIKFEFSIVSLKRLRPLTLVKGTARHVKTPAVFKRDIFEILFFFSNVRSTFLYVMRDLYVLPSLQGEGVRRRPSLQEKGGTPSEEGRDWRLSATLSRKHEWESGHKKASSRAWHPLFMVLDSGRLSAFKDERHHR